MRNVISRRSLLKAGLTAGVGTAFGTRIGLPTLWAAESSDLVCVAVCSHWSYIGIGWQLGIESNILSVTDAMEIADRPPHVKTNINLDARAYELIAEQFPEVANRLKRYLTAGKVELIGGSYGQPMGTTVSGESNIRQIVVGRETIREVLGYEMVTFFEEEEFSHPQLPQILAGAGYRHASLAQLDTWGRAGCPSCDQNVIRWKGIDGTALTSIPKNSLFWCWDMFYRVRDLKKISQSADFKKLQTLGVPLLCYWEEFGWESPEHPEYLDAPRKYQKLADQYPVEFVTIREYLAKHGADPKETVFFPMDAWNKSLTWGLGGDQVRIFGRKVEGTLLAAELFDAAAACLGDPSRSGMLDEAWKDLMASQSHDVGMCEFSRWQMDNMAPLDRLEDHHNFTWGTMGFQHLDQAQRQGKNVLDRTLDRLASRINSAGKPRGPLAVTVFNPHGWNRTNLVMTGRVWPLPENTRDLAVKDQNGRSVPSQIVKSTKDEQGRLVVAEVAFLASRVPSAGYDTYYLEPTTGEPPKVESCLIVDREKLILENEHLRVGLDPVTGAVASLIHKPSGRETLDGRRGAFPHFTGRPNPNLSLRPKPPERYDSALSTGQLDWVAKGPLFATVRAKHRWKYLNYETRVTLAMGRPYVEIVTRVFAQVPPHSDAAPADVKEGYWVSLAPAFNIAEVLRDYPLAVEATKKNAFHALAFVNLVGKDRGLLVLHPGTQWFTRDEKGVVSNLLMREWESHFTKEYGWPLYAEYRHALMPYETNVDNATCLRAAADFAQPLLCRVGAPCPGDLPPSRSFVQSAPAAVMLSALRKKPGGNVELRVVESNGQPAQSRIDLALPMTSAIETNLLGQKIGEISIGQSRLEFPIEPWKIRTFELSHSRLQDGGYDVES